MQGIGHTIPPYPGQNRQVGAGGGCRSCCSISPHPHSHSLDIASGSAPSLAGGTGFSVPGIFRSRDRSRPRGSVIEGGGRAAVYLFSNRPGGPETVLTMLVESDRRCPGAVWGKSLFWKRRESPFALLCGCRQYERLLGKRFEFGARENYEKEFVQFFLPAASSSPAISRAPPATAGESGAVCVGVVIGFSVT